MQCSKLFTTANIVTGLLLFIFFSLSLFFASQGKPFWMDETEGLYVTMLASVWDILIHGASKGQANNSPLPFLIDRLWLLVAGDHPQKYFDLRFYFRIPHVTAWASANTFLFFYVQKIFRYWPLKNWQIYFLALGTALFTYSNNFASYYAIETRAYAFWLSISLVHLLLVWDLLMGEKRQRTWICFFLLSYLLVLTTYAAIAQVYLALFVLHFNQTGGFKKAFRTMPSKKILFLAFSIFALGIYYYLQKGKMNYTPAPFSLYLSSLMEVLLKAFHHHGPHPAWISFPLLFGIIPWFWRKRHQAVHAMNLYALLLLALSLVFYWLTIVGKVIFASRYLVYLVPCLTYLYLLGIFTVFYWLSAYTERRWGKAILLPLLLIFSLSQIGGQPVVFAKSFSSDLSRFYQRNSIKRSDLPECNAILDVQDPEPFEALNDLCRGINASKN